MKQETKMRMNHKGQYMCEACADGVSSHRCDDGIHRCDGCFLNAKDNWGLKNANRIQPNKAG